MSKKAEKYILSGAVVRIKCTEGAWGVKVDLPNGVPFKLEWKGPDFVADVPTKIEYIDYVEHTKKVYVFSENFAQHLLDSYDYLETVEIIKPEVVEAPVVTKSVKSKGKKNE